MENTGYISLSQQVVLRRKMDMVAQNLANMNTPGFKSQHMIQTSQEMAKKQSDGSVLMPMDYGQFNDFNQGPMQNTGNQLDLAIQGDAFFAIQHITNGNTYYTRAGNFQLNELGEIVTPAGHKLLVDGAEVVVPPGAREIAVDDLGRLSTNLGQLGQIDLVTFASNQDLKEFGDNLYASEDEGEQAEGVKVIQGALEGSNVNPVIEMTKMIEINRQYQTNQQTLQNEHERLRNAIAKLGKIRE